MVVRKSDNIDAYNLSSTDRRQIQQDIEISVKQLEASEGISLSKVMTEIRNKYEQHS